MRSLESTQIRKRFTESTEVTVQMPQPKPHPAAFKKTFDAAADEKRFMSDLEQVLVSINALSCCSLQSQMQADERVQKMLQSLQSISAPYLRNRFKLEAQQVVNRKSVAAELRVARKSRRGPGADWDWQLRHELWLRARDKKHHSKFMEFRAEAFRTPGVYIVPVPKAPGFDL